VKNNIILQEYFSLSKTVSDGHRNMRNPTSENDTRETH
jgi:hypothetical protein